MRGDREAQPHVHARRVRPYGQVDELLQARERDDLVQLLTDLRTPEAVDGAVQEDVLATGEVEVEPGAELEERSDPAPDRDMAGRGLDDPRQQPQQRGL